MAALSWKSNFTETECRIFRGKVIAGILKTTLLKYDGRGELDGHMLTFKSKGFFQSRTEIRDIEGKNLLGSIEYNVFRSKAHITYDGVCYDWRLDSWLRGKWTVSDGESEARFESAGFWKNEGQVINEDIPPPVILASFFIQSFFHKISAVS
ncbi:hypothetical protein SAMN05216327_12257 [Dyadobacter sp. SG02]|uniref:hypothetical protein n=1 Tax=Dyadobacter sp. SG02 TaxID=1855291 RepID=UPI0008D717E8|nr:hypothetical protein [Dyadobacter sp. SG02]SEJ82949.1 hypothetical protein SAMN05216327_12257 [Dyadobacter sp. SG02]